MTTAPTVGLSWGNSSGPAAHRYLAPAILAALDRCGARRVLDLGCGNGALTQRIVERGFDVVGLDASPSGIAIARANVSAATFIEAAIDEPLPVDLRGAFDVVTAVEVIEHLLAPRALAARAHDALRPGGWLILTTPYHGYWKNMALAAAGRLDRHWEPERDGGHIKFFSQHTLSALLEEQRFVVKRFSRLGRLPAFAKSMMVEARAQP
jgi:2-polyprenyl-3-methyl-5-hydroxy-6-metoxy-1,4-benzoquinol methylase